MKDVLPYIAELLGNIAETELAFCDAPYSLPRIILSELENSASVILGGKDRYSLISIQADVYDRDEKRCREKAEAVNAILAEKGIKRSSAQFITDEDAPRMCMRYKFGIDEMTGRTVSL